MTNLEAFQVIATHIDLRGMQPTVIPLGFEQLVCFPDEEVTFWAGDKKLQTVTKLMSSYGIMINKDEIETIVEQTLDRAAAGEEMPFDERRVNWALVIQGDDGFTYHWAEPRLNLSTGDWVACRFSISKEDWQKLTAYGTEPNHKTAAVLPTNPFKISEPLSEENLGEEKSRLFETGTPLMVISENVEDTEQINLA